MKPVLASAGLFVASIIIRVVLCKALASGEEQDAKAEQQSANLYLHEKILGVVTAGICLAVIADKIGSTIGSQISGKDFHAVAITPAKKQPRRWVEPILSAMTAKQMPAVTMPRIFSCKYKVADCCSALASCSSPPARALEATMRMTMLAAKRPREAITGLIMARASASPVSTIEVAPCKMANRTMDDTSSIIAAAATNCPRGVANKSRSFIKLRVKPMPVEASAEPHAKPSMTPKPMAENKM